MTSVDFRKVNIDQYDEDQIVEDELYEPDPRDPATVLADAKAKAAAVRGLIAKSVVLSAPTPSPSLRKAALIPPNFYLSQGRSRRRPEQRPRRRPIRPQN